MDLTGNVMMLLAVTVNGWTVLNKLVEVLTPIAIVVVLPVLVVWLIMRARQHEVDKKAEILMKAVEEGAQIDPSFFQKAGKKKTVKGKLMGYLTTAMITGAIGLITMVVQIVFYSKLDIWDNGDGALIIFVILSGIILAVGIAFLIVYFGCKKIYGKELAASEDRE